VQAKNAAPAVFGNDSRHNIRGSSYSSEKTFEEKVANHSEKIILEVR